MEIPQCCFGEPFFTAFHYSAFGEFSAAGSGAVQPVGLPKAVPWFGAGIGASPGEVPIPELAHPAAPTALSGELCPLKAALAGFCWGLHSSGSSVPRKGLSESCAKQGFVGLLERIRAVQEEGWWLRCWDTPWQGQVTLWGEGQVWSREQRPKTLAQHHCSVQRAFPKEGAVGCQMVPVF